MRQATVNAGVIAALVMSLLAASGMPAGASSSALQASDDYVVGSSHSTDSDFSNAQELTNLSIEGSGDSASVVLEEGGQQDEFDDGSLTGWTTDVGTWTESGGWLNGGTAEHQIRWTDAGQLGDSEFTASVVIQPDSDEPSSNANPGLLYLAQDADNYYQIQVDGGSDQIGIIENTGGSLTTVQSVSASVDSSHEFEVALDYSGGNAEATVTDLNTGDSWTVSYSHNPSSDFGTTTGYLGLKSWSGDAEDVRFDDMTLYGGAAPTSATYVSATHEVSGAEEAAINIEQASNVSVDATVRTDGGTTLATDTFTSASNHTLTLSNTSSSQLETVLDVTVTGEDPQFELADESILFGNHAPEADNLSPPDGTELDSSSVEFTADVSDEEFSTVQSDEVTATLFVDGESVGSQTVTSNQTVSVNHELSEGGDHTYHWELTDSYGDTTTTATQTVTVPATLEIRDATDSSQLVDADNATVTFYGGENEREIVERDASGGTVSLEGLPTDTEFTVVVRADGYYTRQTIIPSLYDQSNIWMLPRNDTDAVEIVFLLDDRTGDFANSDETQLRVQRAIEHNNSTEWRDVVGDDISATAELATTLQNQQRYRLVISNDVQTRILGSYTPSGPADPETIPIGRIDFQGDSSQGTAFDAALVNETQPGVQLMYRDPDTVADSLTYRVLNVTSENESVAVANTTISSPDAFTSVTEALPDGTTLEDSTYRVELWAYADDGSLLEQRSATVGTITGPGDWGDGVNNGVLTLTGYLLLVGIGYGTGNYNPKLGVLAAVIVGASLTVFNVVAIPHVVLGFTGTIALIVNAAART